MGPGRLGLADGEPHPAALRAVGPARARAQRQVCHDDGGFLCVSDFVWRRQRVIGEYQGADHFESFGRGDDDISRRLLAEDSHCQYIEVTKTDYFNAGRRHSMLSRFARYLGVEGAAFRPSRALESRFPTPSTVCRGRG